MALKVARRGGVPPFIVMEVMQAAADRVAAGKDVLHMEVGQPSTGAPQGVIAAAKAALDGNVLGYTVALGVPELRQRIARHYCERHGLTVAPERIVVTTGSSGAFLLAFLAGFDPGDRVAILRPGYPCYRNILTALDIEPLEVPVGPATRYQPTPDLLDRAGARGAAGLLLASPANPTGSMLRPQEMAAIVDYCRNHGIRFISDEIYHGICYGAAAPSALAFDQDAVVINSFSKYFSMTGWRLGWAVLPEELLRPVERLAQNLFISPPTLPQLAAVAAFDCTAELEANVARYAHNRALLMRELPAAGFDRLAPADGAFYLYADISKLTNDSQAFCRRMLSETGVAATPGVDFDPVDGHKTMRFCYAGSTADMAEAARRLRAWQR
ncbi:MAG: pyridoxal phosphate-dependent aminotransferase [Alphaproteobacteria bacterium]|nr:pyridoxal phosphate-dependent aminotransferase [Alphaproteobacteria bacterium]